VKVILSLKKYMPTGMSSSVTATLAKIAASPSIKLDQFIAFISATMLPFSIGKINNKIKVIIILDNYFKAILLVLFERTCYTFFEYLLYYYFYNIC